jgi:hypothetical protein
VVVVAAAARIEAGPPAAAHQSQLLWCGWLPAT